MKRTISLWLRWVGVVLMVLVAGWASAQPVTPIAPSNGLEPRAHDEHHAGRGGRAGPGGDEWR